ncbi:MAG TPA: hypothetical protein VN893_09355 [Bryobacteraceae bacterium]|nr:hypothetical protein [Bryobacteraceae bacterium]
MNLQLKGLGAEPKKLAILGVAVVALAVVVYMNMGGSSSSAPAPQPRAAQSAVPAASPEFGATVLNPPAEARQRASQKAGRGRVKQQFKLGIGDKQPDPSSIDPTLRLDLLARVQAVNMAGGVRNLFQFGPSPLPKIPEVNISPLVTGPAVPTPTPGPPPTPPPPPIPLKFYGYATPAPSGAKRVFLLDGDDIIVAAEGQLVKSRYKLVRVGINSVVLEDVQFKHQQTLPLEEEKPGQTG